MLTMTIKITGNATSDLEAALDEVKRLTGEEYLSGHNSNDTGSFSFGITGEEETADDEDEQ